MGFPREGFLLAADVSAGCVDFIVALSLEIVETFLIFLKGGDAGATRFLILGFSHVQGGVVSGNLHPVQKS